MTPVKATAWDPKSPFTLLLPSLQEGKAATIDRLYSHAGTGCDEFELAALMRILQAHEDYYAGIADGDEGAAVQPTSLKRLALEYRLALHACFTIFEQTASATANGRTKLNYDLLKCMYAVLEQSQIFIPLVQASDVLQNPMDTPGYATADCVRYLRYNHTAEPETIDADIPEMMHSLHPEEFGDGSLYWKLITTLVLRGCLDKAWEVLSKHSLNVSCNASLLAHQATDPYESSQLNEVVTGFQCIKELFNRAPLPGGRSSDFDDFSDEMEFTEQVGDTDYFLEHLEVATTDYTFWENEGNAAAGRDLPVSYNQEAAIRKHRVFQNYVRDRRSSFQITRRVPQIDALLSILMGDLSKVHFENWNEQLLAELLYKQPNVRPRHISARARKFITDCGEDVNEPTNHVKLCIMDGNAGEAIHALSNVGGNSGAALPSTLTALFYSLFSEAEYIPPEYAFQKIDHLTEAAHSILSSLDESHPGVGARQAVRLLLPYATKEDHEEVVAAISEILQHQAPQTDADARTLLSLCRPLVERKSVRILDGCQSVALCRYRWHIEHKQSGGGIEWLLLGIDLESLVYTEPMQGSCYRTLTVACFKACDFLLQCVVGTTKVDGAAYVGIQAMVAALQSSAYKTESIPAVRQVCCVLTIFDSMALETIDYEETASQIVTLLSDSKDETTGTNSTLSSPSMHWYLLQVVKKIFDADEKELAASGAQVFCSAFDTEGVAVISDRLTQIDNFLSDGAENGPTKKEVGELRASLGRALARAFVAENATKKSYRANPRSKREAIVGIYSTDLCKHSLSVQESVVRSMLD